MKIVETHCRNCSVSGVRVYEMRHVDDPVRGHLTAGEFGRDLPFVPQRFFITYDIPAAQIRGEHAHLRCEQFLVCVHGRCCVQVDDGQHREQITLNHPSLGIYVPPMVWAAEFKHEPGSALRVLPRVRMSPRITFAVTKSFSLFLLSIDHTTSRHHERDISTAS